MIQMVEFKTVLRIKNWNYFKFYIILGIGGHSLKVLTKLSLGFRVMMKEAWQQNQDWAIARAMSQLIIL